MRIDWQEYDSDHAPPLASKSNMKPPITAEDVKRMREYSNQLSNYLAYKIPNIPKHEARHLTTNIIEEQNRVYKWLSEYGYFDN